MVDEKIQKLKFEIACSKRYHARRMAWHKEMLFFLQFVELFVASAGLLVPMSELWHRMILCLGFIVAGLSLVQVAGKNKQWHESKKAAFGELMKSILAKEGLWTEKDLRDILVRREEIEKDDDVGFRCLDIICYNEECIAEGLNKDVKPLSWWQRHVGKILPLDYWPSIEMHKSIENQSP